MKEHIQGGSVGLSEEVSLLEQISRAALLDELDDSPRLYPTNAMKTKPLSKVKPINSKRRLSKKEKKRENSLWKEPIGQTETPPSLGSVTLSSLKDGKQKARSRQKAQMSPPSSNKLSCPTKTKMASAATWTPFPPIPQKTLFRGSDQFQPSTFMSNSMRKCPLAGCAYHLKSKAEVMEAIHSRPKKKVLSKLDLKSLMLFTGYRPKGGYCADPELIPMRGQALKLSLQDKQESLAVTEEAK